MPASDSIVPPPAESLDPATSTARFSGQVALVTGASDRGIGGAIAERLAKEGAQVVLAVRHEPKRLIKRLEKLGRGHLVTHCDVTNSDEVRATVESCIQRFGRLDAVINNAGVEMAAKIDEFAESDWKALLDVNLNGAITTIQAALPKLTQPGGVIVNVASALALGGCAGFSIYSASKAGMVGLTQSLAWELAPRGIRVVAVAPAMVHTPMIHKHIEHLTAESWAKIQACHPLGMGSPHDVAAAVAFLASQDARWITGVTLPLGFAGSFPLPTEPFLG
jgi:NAD(P)-dependent dehydrogenase (short-subunit alcohol dehydrogenase family)